MQQSMLYLRWPSSNEGECNPDVVQLASTANTSIEQFDKTVKFIQGYLEKNSERYHLSQLRDRNVDVKDSDAANQSKKKGNEYFEKKNWTEAARCYTEVTCSLYS